MRVAWYSQWPSYTCKLCLHSSLCLKKINKLIMYFIYYYLNCSFIFSSIDAGPETIWYVCIVIICIHLSVFCRILCVQQPGLLDASIVCGLNSLFHVSHLSLDMLSAVCLGVQCACTTKNLYLAFLSLCLNLTVHMHNCLIPD